MFFINIDEETNLARTLVQIKKQIQQLEKEADRAHANEVAGVIRKIKTAIDFYGLTAEDLFGSGKIKSAAKGKTPAPKKVKKSPSPAKYQDKATGKTWTGHGKRPAWFVSAIESGMKAEDMAV
jgi:DNA-binding protein H-NS